MLSTLRKGLVYKNISSDIVEHDLDIDADEWSYDGKDVYRGSVDPEYVSNELNVYWLYDDNLKRVGLAEHESKEPEVFKALWFHENPFATLYQDDSWKSTGNTLWSKLSNEAYQDYLEGLNIRDQALNSGLLLVTPSMLIDPPKIYVCYKCGKKSFESSSCSLTQTDLDFSAFSILFVDDDFVIYEKSSSLPQSDACAEEQQPEQTVQAGLQESSDAQTPLQSPPLQ